MSPVLRLILLLMCKMFMPPFVSGTERAYGCASETLSRAFFTMLIESEIYVRLTSFIHRTWDSVPVYHSHQLLPDSIYGTIHSKYFHLLACPFETDHFRVKSDGYGLRV